VGREHAGTACSKWDARAARDESFDVVPDAPGRQAFGQDLNAVGAAGDVNPDLGLEGRDWSAPSVVSDLETGTTGPKGRTIQIGRRESESIRP
jgi:hypothetical protein